MATEDEDFAAGFYEEAFGRFEAWGEDLVWLDLSNGSLPIRDREAALIWLGQRSRAKIKAARRANIIATIAAIIAIANTMWLVITDIFAIHPFR